MNNNLIEHIRALNIKERAEHNARKEKALQRIKELRRAIKEQRELKHDERC